MGDFSRDRSSGKLTAIGPKTASRDWGGSEAQFRRTGSGNVPVERFDRTGSGSFVIPQFERTKSGRYRTPSERGVDVVRVGKVLTSVLDALVRSIRAGGRNVLEIAQRALQIWHDEPDMILILAPNAIAVGSQVAYEAKDGAGDWILPLFMSGVRRISLRPNAGPGDLCRFAEQLGKLEPTPSSVTRFRDWVWSDGASGLVLDSRMSYTEAFEALDVQFPTVVSGIASGDLLVPVTLFPQTAPVGSGAVLKEALQTEFQTLREAREDGRVASTGRERDALRAGCSDPELWGIAELETAISDSRLIKAVAPERIANALWSRLTIATDSPVVRILTDLYSIADEHSVAILTLLERAPLGPTLARALTVESPGLLVAVDRFIAVCPTRVASGFVHELLARADDDVEIFDALVQLVSGVGGKQFTAWIEPGLLSPEAATTLAFLSAESFADGTDLSKIVSKAPNRAAVALVEALPAPTLLKMKAQLKRLMMAASGKSLSRLVVKLRKTGARECIKIIGDDLLEHGGEDWSEEALKSAFEGLVGVGLGSEYVMPIVRSRRAPTSARLAALDSLAGDQELLAEASRWRPSEVIDDPDMKKRLKALRKEDPQ